MSFRLALVLLTSLAGLLAESGDALIDAARADDSATVAALVRQGADVNARAEDGTTALAWAASHTNGVIAELLLDKGANPDLTNELGISPLSLAINNGSTAMVKLLLGKGANPNVARENGETPLMTAARLGQVEVMRLLIDRGGNVNAREKKFGQTALMWAAGYPAAVHLLVNHGADVVTATTAWDVKYTIYAPTTATLGKTGIPWNTDGAYNSKKGGLNALFFAVQKHNLESARILLDAGLDVNQPAADGTTPLLAALYNWDPPDLTFVPGKGAPAQAGTSQRFHADLAMARLLLDRGAKLGGADGAGYTALHAAALAVANAMLGPDLRRGGAYGGKAALLTLGRVDKAAPASQVDEALSIASKLLAAGADPNRQTRYPTAGPAGDVRINPAPPGSSAFHIAASSRNLELVKMMAQNGANPNLFRKDGHTPFSVAVIAGDLPVVKEFAAHGAELTLSYNPTEKIPDPVDPITLPRQKQTIMHLAVLGGSPAVIEYLYSQGVSLDGKNSAGETPLDLADHQERYREAIERQGAEGDPEKLKKVVRPTTISDTIRKLLAATTTQTSGR
ncbi:MAG TPA: ankyrin repeat domain-containing protein [Bryobacteraceae bacterium]|nr:ankyrin repeat domain-containing protein [Bryobacteraceae bacterium]